MNVVMAFLADHLTGSEVTTKNVSAYLQRHGYAYMLTMPTDATRVDVKRNDIVVFYTRTLPEALNGVHSSLVFNMDEMGAEMFADRKRIFVFVPVENLTDGQLAVGVPRSTRRCTLVACICLDGSRLRHTVITKTMTISSAVFAEGGLTSERVKFAHTENSFINNDVFGEWLCDVFLPEVMRKRAWLREKYGTFNERAVLILDGLKCHTMEPFVELLRRHNVTMVVLVPHSSHMTQPLDVGIFARVKNLIRASGKYRLNLPQLDHELAEQTAEETAGREVPPERGRLLADYVVSILRSFEQAAVPDNVVSAFAQVGIHSKLVDTDPDNRVTYIDPATARVVVDNYGVIALPDELQTDPSPAVQLKISDLNSHGQSAIAQQLRGELAEIREALAPPAARRLTHDVHSPTGNVPELPEPPGHELPEPPVPPRRLPVPPRRLFGALPRAPSPPTPSLLPTPPAPRSAEQVVSLHQLTLRRRVRSPTGER